MERRSYLAGVSSVALPLVAGCSTTSTEGNDDNPITTPPEPTPTATEPDENDPITVTPKELLPTPRDFDEVGWIANDIEMEPDKPTEAEYASRVFAKDSILLIFEVWVYETVDAAKTEYDERINERIADRSIEEVDIGVEGVAYELGGSIVDFRDANVRGRVTHLDSADGSIMAAKQRAAMMHRLWRG